MELSWPAQTKPLSNVTGDDGTIIVSYPYRIKTDTYNPLMGQKINLEGVSHLFFVVDFVLYF